MADSQVPQVQVPHDAQVNVFNPEGDLVSIRSSQMQDAQNMGYRQASPEDVHSYQLQDEYGTGTQQAKTFLEGAGKGLTFGASTGLERLAGVSPKDIKSREEANPIASTAGEITGLAGSTLIPGFGEANILEKTGAAGAKALGLGGETLLSKVGSAAVKGAIETSMVQGGNEVHRMFVEDPNQTLGTAITDVGLAGLMGGGIGGGLGAVSPLWEATAGKKMGTLLDAFKRRANGETLPLPAALEAAVEKSGIEIAPEVRAVLSGDPELKNQWSKLMESSTTPGLDMQKAVGDFKKRASGSLLNALGHTDDSIPLPSEVSKFDAGSNIIKKFSDDLEAKFKPVSEEFKSISDKLKTVPLDQEKNVLADNLAQIANDNRWSMFSDSAENRMYNSVMKGIPNLKTLEDLRLAQSKIWQMAGENDLWSQAGKMVGALRDVETQTMERAAGEKGAETLAKLKSARLAYGAERESLDDLAAQLKIKGYKGPDSFIETLRDKVTPESIINKLNPKDNAKLIDFLQQGHPEVAKMVKDYQLNKVLSESALRAGKGEPINAKALFNKLDSMPPEMKNFLFQKNVQDKVSAVRAVMDSLPDHKSSFTAKNLDSIWSKVPGGAMAMASYLTGHNSGVGFVLGQAGKWLTRDAPDAIRLMMLKYLGHAGPVNPAAFKSAVDYAAAVFKGEAATNKAVNALFKAGAEVFPRSKLPTETDRKKLNKQLLAYSSDPTKLMDVAGKTSYYLPEHAQAMTATATRAVSFLDSIKPREDKLGPLDPPQKPSVFQIAKYNRAIDVVDKPLSVLQSVKDGSVTQDDIVALKTVHPDLYNKLSMKIMEQVNNVASKDQMLPYQARLGLSMFLGQPLDSSMKPQSILMNQPQEQAQAQPAQQAPPGTGPRNYKALNKMAQQSLTPEQARSAKRSSLS